MREIENIEFVIALFRPAARDNEWPETILVLDKNVANRIWMACGFYLENVFTLRMYISNVIRIEFQTTFDPSTWLNIFPSRQHSSPILIPTHNLSYYEQIIPLIHYMDYLTFGGFSSSNDRNQPLKTGRCYDWTNSIQRSTLMGEHNDTSNVSTQHTL